MAFQQGGMFIAKQSINPIPRCKCGTPIHPNPANLCSGCLRTEIDITAGLLKRVAVAHCPECDSYHQPPNNSWVRAPRESKELMQLCLNRLNLKAVDRLVGCEFVWTEPHSRRIKLRLQVQKEIVRGAVVEQSYTVEFGQESHMCDSCSCSRYRANPDQWTACVQLRQNVGHRRMFFYLEQMILKHGGAASCFKIRQVNQGIDFFFGNRSHAIKFVEFLNSVAPVRAHDRDDRKLVSEDGKSNRYDFKYAFSVEISPICREDLICLPRKLASKEGNFGPIVICTKVNSTITLLDPYTLRERIMDSEKYWRSGFKSLLTSQRLVEYIVLDVEVPSPPVEANGYLLADVQVARMSDFGRNDRIFSVRTHLGRILRAGDRALGYDLYTMNCNESELEGVAALQEAVLVKKSYQEARRRRSSRRSWKLKSLEMEVDESDGVGKEKVESEYEQFLRDLEENPELRFPLSLYRDKDYEPEMDSVSTADGEEVPEVPLEELIADIADLGLNDKEEEEEDASMRE